MFKLTSLNLNGIRSATSKGLPAWLEKSRPDCMCVQELKAQAPDVAGKFEQLAGLQGHFHYAEKKGYSGVGIYTRHAPSEVIVGFGSGEFDAEGRYLELRFDSPARKHLPKLSIISCYFPSGSSGPERQEAKFRFLAEFYPHLLGLKAQREFILCGDVNIAHQEIDLKNWKGNLKNSGFLPEERAWMDKWFDNGMIDTFREFHPEPHRYTWWSFRANARANNKGWRIDYISVTDNLKNRLKSADILADAKHSDHCPSYVVL